MTNCKIILLDLNYTLVSNRDQIKSLKTDLEEETYRQWLVEMIRSRYVALVTARPIMYQYRTLANIKKKMGWAPQEHYFNIGFTPPDFKEMVLHERILVNDRFTPDQCLAIESNPKTRAMYHCWGVRTIHVIEGIQWIQPPAGSLQEVDYDCY